MIIKQLSIFIEDKIGRMTEMTRILAENDINITAFCVAEAPDYGIFRLIVSNPDLAVQKLKENNFVVHLTDVVCLVVPHRPGGLHRALQILSSNNIAIDYMYAFAFDDKASVVIRTSSNDEVIRVLQANQVELLKASDIYQI